MPLGRQGSLLGCPSAHRACRAVAPGLLRKKATWPYLLWLTCRMRSPPEGCCLESCEPMTSWVVIMQVRGRVAAEARGLAEGGTALTREDNC